MKKECKIIKESVELDKLIESSISKKIDQQTVSLVSKIKTHLKECASCYALMYQLVRKYMRNSLSKEHWNVFTKIEIEGHLYKNVAKQLNIPEGTVKSRIQTVREIEKKIIMIFFY